LGPAQCGARAPIGGYGSVYDQSVGIHFPTEVLNALNQLWIRDVPTALNKELLLAGSDGAGICPAT
jgi:hypothetical protein